LLGDITSDQFFPELERLGLKQDPFGISANPRFLWLAGGHLTAYQHTKSVITRRQGLALIMGDVGMGKTTLARLLFEEYFGAPGMITTYIPSANWRSRGLATAEIADSLTGGGMKTVRSNKRDPDGTLRAIYMAISETHHEDQKKNIVLLIDESHLIGPVALETIHAIYNFEFDTKAVQMLLFGQPELEALMQTAPHLDSRVIKRVHLSPLSYPEAHQMVSHRLATAGRSVPLFEDEAFLALYDSSGGVPRDIVALCSLSLDILIAVKKDLIDRPIVEEAIELRGYSPKQGPELEEE
jgi:general secretion pathway protein A